MVALYKICIDLICTIRIPHAVVLFVHQPEQPIIHSIEQLILLYELHSNIQYFALHIVMYVSIEIDEQIGAWARKIAPTSKYLSSVNDWNRYDTSEKKTTNRN